jgi:hypothetical protein
MERVLDLFQRDLADQLTVSATIRSANVLVTAATSVVQIGVTAEVAESTQAQIDISFDVGNEVTLNARGEVEFDTSKLGDTARKIADALTAGFGGVLGDAANFVANALTVFTVGTNIGAGNVLKGGANGKVTLSFKPCFLRDFSLAATMLP